jgi:serine-type D-Ala-D-Ala carboxypeptidase/endopeptidase (penicillin-binding protein 4)
MQRSRPGLKVTRRRMLAGLAATGALASPAHLLAETSAAIVRFGRQGVSSVALRDLEHGRMLEQYDATRSLPPASVLKIMTALYALDALGPGYRFTTSLRATGPRQGGTLRGSLVLVGSGDPTLDANALDAMTKALTATGLRTVDGAFLAADGALPGISEIDPTQPAHVGYNPAISGLNLNYNRVRVEWAPGRGGPDFSFFAPGQTFRVALAGIGGELGPAAPPRHRMDGSREIWAMPGSRMRGAGGLWLPVRQPAAHAAEVFRTRSAERGLALPEPQIVANPPAGVDLVIHESAPLAEILRGMLRYSTNLTAEIVGLRASQRRGFAPATLAESGGLMTDWARARYGLTEAVFGDHSGLSDVSRWSAAETVRVLAAASDGPLPHLLHEQVLTEEAGRPVAMPHVEARAKTGTLYFVSGLAGYLTTADRQLAFAVQAADMGRRATIVQPASETPPGARSWAAASRAMQRDLLRDWVASYLPAPAPRPRHRPG